MQVLPSEVLMRQVRLPWRYTWNCPVPAKAIPFGAFGVWLSVAGAFPSAEAGAVLFCAWSWASEADCVFAFPFAATGTVLTVPGVSERLGVAWTELPSLSRVSPIATSPSRNLALPV